LLITDDAHFAASKRENKYRDEAFGDTTFITGIVIETFMDPKVSVKCPFVLVVVYAGERVKLYEKR
jgi:hypothetical protein